MRTAIILLVILLTLTILVIFLPESGEPTRLNDSPSEQTAHFDPYRNAWDDYHSGDYWSAMATFEELADSGNVYAQAIMGIHRATETRLTEGEASAYDSVSVLSRISGLHNSGDIEATFLLALMHDEGWGAPQDSRIAMDLYLVAAEANHTAAQGHLAECYELGANEDIAREGAKELIDDPSDWELDLAAGYLSCGIEQDIPKAIYWYDKAAENGSVWAKQMADKLRDGQ
jgi:TPR repeat protein